MGKSSANSLLIIFTSLPPPDGKEKNRPGLRRDDELPNEEKSSE